MFKYLDNPEGNCYFIRSRVQFPANSPIDLKSYLHECCNFAYQMTLSGEGYYRNHRSGGTYNRTPGEQFVDTLKGKMAEFGVYKFFRANSIRPSVPDLTVANQGLYDLGDMNIKDKRICIKSSTYFANLLLLETKDWKEDGNYAYDLIQGLPPYEYFIFCRIKPDIKQWANYVDSREWKTYENLENSFVTFSWEMDIPGYITREDLKSLIAGKYIIKKGSLLNGKIPLDADNYYCMASDMHNINELVEEFK